MEGQARSACCMNMARKGSRLFDWFKRRLRSLKARTLDAVTSAEAGGLLACASPAL